MEPSLLAGSIEGFIGYSRVPLGIAGPLRIAGAAALGEFFVPFATSEGTLVASFQHSFNAMNRCGGVTALCSDEQVGRAPCFEFADLPQAGKFAQWLPSRLADLQQVTEGTSRYCRLRTLSAWIVGNTVYVLFEFSTGDAAGQNMVTLATKAICQKLLGDMPDAPRSWLIESMLSGDKRATPMAFRSTRGRNVSAEVLLSSKQIERYWRTTVLGMERAWRQASNSAAQTGTVGLQGNVANALAALFIACGQDVACVAEATTRADPRRAHRRGRTVHVHHPAESPGGHSGRGHVPADCAGMPRYIGLRGHRPRAEVCGDLRQRRIGRRTGHHRCDGGWPVLPPRMSPAAEKRMLQTMGLPSTAPGPRRDARNDAAGSSGHGAGRCAGQTSETDARIPHAPHSPAGRTRTVPQPGGDLALYHRE